MLYAPETVAVQVADENIHIHADHMSQDSEEAFYTAEGNVVVDWKDSKLTADKVRYNTETRMLYAYGAVVLTKEKSVLKGETLVVNTETGHAEIDPGLLTVPDKSMTIKADKFIRISEDQYKATATELTSCDIADPSWKFGSSKMNVDVDGFATGRNVIFYIKDIPVLYIPWIAFPVSRERRSGLLFPRYGNSTSRGLQLDIPIYWAISPSQDLQLDLNLMERRGVGTGVNYRYIRSRESEGHTSAFQIYDKVEKRLRWQLALDHREIFSPTSNLRVSVNKSSDRTFLTDYGVSNGDYNRQSNESIITALKTGQNYAATSYLRYTEHLYASANNATIQQLPSIGISGVRHALPHMPLYFDLDSSADNFYRELAPSGQRIYLYPRLTLLPFKSGIIQTTFTAGAHVRGYNTGNRDITSNVQALAGDILPQFGTRFSSSLTRSFDFDSPAVKRVRHEVIPEFNYTFVPKQDQQRLPFYDYTDRMIHQNMVALSATNLISGTFASGSTNEYRELSRIKVEARYSFAGEQRDLLTPAQSHTPWSDLIFDSETWLTKQLKFIFDTRYSLYGDNVSTVATGLEFTDQKGSSVRAEYHMARDVAEYLEASISTTRIKPLNLSYTARYSFDRGDFLESVYSAEYHHKCWSVKLAVNQRPESQSYTVNFVLAGLGSIIGMSL